MFNSCGYPLHKCLPLTPKVTDTNEIKANLPPFLTGCLAIQSRLPYS